MLKKLLLFLTTSGSDVKRVAFGTKQHFLMWYNSIKQVVLLAGVSDPPVLARNVALVVNVNVSASGVYIVRHFQSNLGGKGDGSWHLNLPMA